MLQERGEDSGSSGRARLRHPAPLRPWGSAWLSREPYLLALPLVLQLFLHWVLPGAALRVGGWGLPATGELRAVRGSLLWG